MGRRWWIRIVGTGIGAPFLVVLYLNIEKLAERHGWDGLLVGLLEGHMPSASNWLLQPWVAVLAVAVVSFMAGVWLDWSARHFDRRQTQSLATLSINTDKVIGLLRDALNSDDEHLDVATIAELNSLMTSYKRHGLASQEVNASKIKGLVIAEYYRWLGYISPLIRDGHIQEARKLSKSQSKKIHEAVNFSCKGP